MSGATELFALGNDAWQVRVAPALGGAILDARWHGHDVLRPTPAAELQARNVRKTACYPLVPFSNRIAFGEFAFGGAQYTLVKNLADMQHAIHGVGFQRAWSVAAQDSRSIQMRIAHAPDACWPFAFEATQTMAIENDTLTLGLRITNTHTSAAPCGAGWHPFFPLDTPAGETHLRTTWMSMLLNDANDLPCARIEPIEFGALDHTVVDNCFTGWSGQAQIDSPYHRIVIDASETLRCAVLFRPAGQAFFAFEPVSHANNALHGNDPLMQVLAPGEALEARVCITMHALTKLMKRTSR